MKSLPISLLVVLFAADACKFAQAQPATPLSTKKPVGTQVEPTPVPYKHIAEERLGEGVVYLPNENQTLVLCKKTEAPNAPALVNTLRFLVIDLKTAAIVYEDRQVNANVEWFTPTQLKISKILGIVQTNPQPGTSDYIYDLQKKQQLPTTTIPQKY
jgi:hypothetical protein